MTHASIHGASRAEFDIYPAVREMSGYEVRGVPRSARRFSIAATHKKKRAGA
ncbi:hypothetical protein [Burkholderia sp. MSMB2041]|uniref:hypothetical protein n=1 Tax=Burkholderia sp. MSMB2041 TaxID=1637839 RepID=UPI0012E3B059|nr:hypothetical protein [Burkholderia sp. MSMB2041]